MPRHGLEHAFPSSSSRLAIVTAALTPGVDRVVQCSSMRPTLQRSPGVASQLNVLALSTDARTRELALGAMDNLFPQAKSQVVDLEGWLGAGSWKVAKVLAK